MSESPPPTRAAFCEEYNEDAQTALPETRQTASTANIAAKRSKPDAAKPKPVRDEFSDSGYSSHTAATLGSGDSSSLESRREAPPVHSDDASAESSATVKEVEKAAKSRSQSPEKPSLRRTGSKSKANDKTRAKNCDCAQCLAKKAQRMAPPKLNTARLDQHSSRPRQREPPSPISHRNPRPAPAPEAPMLQAAPAARPRVIPPQPYPQARPMSFHAGVMPDMCYIQQPVFAERLPIAGFPTPAAFPPPSYPPPQPSFFPPLQPVPSPQDYYTPLTPVSSLYEVQTRPRPHVNARPQTMYYDSSRPTIDYVAPGYIPLRSPDRVGERQSRRQQPPTLRKESTEESDDYHRMPPPPPPPPPPQRRPSKSRQEQRPVIRHAATASGVYPTPIQRTSGRDLDEMQHLSRPNSRKQSFEGPPRSRRPSVARPPRSSDEKVAQALQLDRDMARMKIVEHDPVSPKSKRRASLYSHESLNDLEGSVEAYQASRSGRDSTSIPAGDDMLRLIRKKTLHTSAGSDAGSRKSGGSKTSRDGSDLKSSRRPSSDLKKRDSNEEGFAMRIPKGANVNFQPSIEGRSISLRPSRDGDGEMELRIGERGRAGTSGLAESRRGIRDKSRKGYSIVEGQEMAESERESGFDTAPGARESISRRGSIHRGPEEARFAGRGIGDDGQRHIIRERIITRTTNRSRRSSRSAYNREDQGLF